MCIRDSIAALSERNPRIKIVLDPNVRCRDYVAFEFLAKSGRFTRHVVAAATVANGKLILFTVGSSERRWNKMKDKLVTSVRSFKAFDVY